MVKIRENPVPGLAAIKELSDTERSWDISDLLFFMGPRVNAAGRMEHAKGAVAVLLGEEPAVDLDSHNADRKKLTQSMAQEALAMIAADSTYDAKASTVLVNGTWAKGVIGIVASRLIETHYRPTIVFTESQGNYVGSARSVAGFDLYGALEKCAPHITQFGGHRHAAGITLRPEQYPDFCAAFDAAVKGSITPEQQVPVFDIAYELPYEQLTARFMKLMNYFQPFGPDNMQPVFLSRGVEVMHVIIMKEEHLKLTVRHRSTILEAVGFFMADAWGRLGNPSHVDMLYQPQVESFNNKLSLKLRIKDLKIHEFPA
jgi:single-stranded-DNA-specific exonuclease